ncbi:MAG: hypothetical protein C5B58_08590 [Acidobacteria bacterium]|nr:MAG: hypothetical protein C5B58_08590 [Acidobacteriota bacterium]
MFFSQTASRDDEYYQSDGAERDPDSGDNSFFRRPRTAREESDYDGRPAAGALHGYPDLKNKQSTAATPSIGRRALRTVARFSLVVLIGVSATLAWQSYNEQAKELVRNWVPAIAWLLPASPVAAENPPKLGEELRPLAIDLALVRRSVEQLALDQRQLAAKQDNIAQDIAALQAVERDLRQNISSVPPPGTMPLPRHRPVQPPAQSPAVQ